MVDLRAAAEQVRSCDAILIGASKGLSITEELNLFACNQTFQEIFGDFQKNTVCNGFCRE